MPPYRFEYEIDDILDQVYLIEIELLAGANAELISRLRHYYLRTLRGEPRYFETEKSRRELLTRISKILRKASYELQTTSEEESQSSADEEVDNAQLTRLSGYVDKVEAVEPSYEDLLQRIVELEALMNQVQINSIEVELETNCSVELEGSREVELEVRPDIPVITENSPCNLPNAHKVDEQTQSFCDNYDTINSGMEPLEDSNQVESQLELHIIRCEQPNRDTAEGMSILNEIGHGINSFDQKLLKNNSESINLPRGLSNNAIELLKVKKLNDSLKVKNDFGKNGEYYKEMQKLHLNYNWDNYFQNLTRLVYRPLDRRKPININLPDKLRSRRSQEIIYTKHCYELEDSTGKRLGVFYGNHLKKIHLPK
ncbi:uncharacterized protein LOC131683010 [Topomyia yanbarensis]|uniref:uncharacterized protein LOC131683010 n=1 Tax=Topomyia yanbarensis TaxID=2498891 RepID=UPI00273ACC68|nr:uncharacterized protein LOC131683010 [Topomyia yanbarensis]